MKSQNPFDTTELEKESKKMKEEQNWRYPFDDYWFMAGGEFENLRLKAEVEKIVNGWSKNNIYKCSDEESNKMGIKQSGVISNLDIQELKQKLGLLNGRKRNNKTT